MINNEAEEMMTEPNATKQDHEMILVRVERTPMGSKAPVHTLMVWDEVFSPALQEARLAEEKRIRAEKNALLQKEREAAKKSLTDTANKMTVKELNAELKEMKALQPSLVNLPKKAKKADLVREMVRVYMNAAALGLTVIVPTSYGGQVTLKASIKASIKGDAQ
tara:strand:- start:350 stop:841 length:492 start_codon:yes stop_codon:yes gene_type:complete